MKRIIQIIRSLDAGGEYRGTQTARGYNLVKRPNAKLGFVYYVRYFHDKKMLPSKWNTHTNDLKEAERFAVENRERLVTGYLQKTAGRERVYELLEKYYEDGSEYQAYEEKRGRSLSDRMRCSYHCWIRNRFIPRLAHQVHRRRRARADGGRRGEVPGQGAFSGKS